MEMGLGVGDRCGHCKQLTPVWEEAAKHLKGVVGVGAVDADAHRELGGVCEVGAVGELGGVDGVGGLGSVAGCIGWLG